MVQFAAINDRNNPVNLFSVKDKVETPRGVVQNGATGRFSGQQNEVWVARDSVNAKDPPVVAVYQVTPRVPAWTIPLAATALPLELEPRDAGDFNESLRHNSRFLAATGTVRAVMLFVDFKGDSAAGNSWANEKEIVARLADNAATEIRKLSFKGLSLTVDPIQGWRQMPNPAAHYANYVTDPLSLIRDAVTIFHPQVDFSKYQVVYVVAAKTSALPISPAWVANGTESIQIGSTAVRFAVVFGEDSYFPTNETFLLLHETYHLFGLPDLYDGGEVSGSGYSDCGLGEWDLMATQEGDSGLLGWHRLKLGWLHPSQMVCLDGSGSINLELTDWKDPQAVKAVMIPVTAGDLEHATLAYVVEVANRGDCASPGILVYSVNASVRTWERPIQMRGGADALSAKPLKVGGYFEHRGAGVKVTVLRRSRDGFDVRVERR